MLINGKNYSRFRFYFLFNVLDLQDQNDFFNPFRQISNHLSVYRIIKYTTYEYS